MDEMTMAQCKIIHSHIIMVATKFQQKIDLGRKK
nr:MAG TPA: hypothetical protein [Caudoviricetes sp.]